MTVKTNLEEESRHLVKKMLEEENKQLKAAVERLEGRNKGGRPRVDSVKTDLRIMRLNHKYVMDQAKKDGCGPGKKLDQIIEHHKSTAG